MLEIIKKIFRFLLNKKEEIKIEKVNNMINWKDPEAKISKFFTVKEATYLPSWKCYHIPSESEKQEIVRLAKIMDVIRERFGVPVVVHVWIRPKKANIPGNPRDGQDYNLFIGSKSTRSGHIFGQAVDFHFKGLDDFNAAREKIKSWLEELDIRMEDIQGNWIHIDTKPVGYNRFFKP